MGRGVPIVVRRQWRRLGQASAARWRRHARPGDGGQVDPLPHVVCWGWPSVAAAACNEVCAVSSRYIHGVWRVARAGGGGPPGSAPRGGSMYVARLVDVGAPQRARCGGTPPAAPGLARCHPRLLPRPVLDPRRRLGGRPSSHRRTPATRPASSWSRTARPPPAVAPHRSVWMRVAGTGLAAVGGARRGRKWPRCRRDGAEPQTAEAAVPRGSGVSSPGPRADRASLCDG